jgi:hypothetical protein
VEPDGELNFLGVLGFGSQLFELCEALIKVLRSVVPTVRLGVASDELVEKTRVWFGHTEPRPHLLPLR